MMDELQIFSLMKIIIVETLPQLKNHPIKPSDSLKDLGANSIDRAEIIIRTMSELNLKIPLVELAPAKNINDIISIFLTRLAV